MGTKLKNEKQPINKIEAAKPDYKNWDDDVKIKKVRKRAKFNYNFVQVAARLVAAGFTEADLGYVLGVQPVTIHSWKERYPQFKAACGNGKEIAKAYLVSKGLRAACGYDYEEETFERKVLHTEEGVEYYELVCTKKVKKHQRPDASLLTFFLINMAPDEFSNTKTVKIDETRNLNLKLTGEVESETIRNFAGKLLEVADHQDKRKKVESKVVE